MLEEEELKADDPIEDDCVIVPSSDHTPAALSLHPYATIRIQTKNASEENAFENSIRFGRREPSYLRELLGVVVGVEVVAEVAPGARDEPAGVAHVAGLAGHGALLAHAEMRVVVATDGTLVAAELALEQVGVLLGRDGERRVVEATHGEVVDLRVRVEAVDVVVDVAGRVLRVAVEHGAAVRALERQVPGRDRVLPRPRLVRDVGVPQGGAPQTVCNEGK